MLLYVQLVKGGIARKQHIRMGGTVPSIERCHHLSQFTKCKAHLKLLIEALQQTGWLASSLSPLTRCMEQQSYYLSVDMQLESFFSIIHDPYYRLHRYPKEPKIRLTTCQRISMTSQNLTKPRTLSQKHLSWNSYNSLLCIRKLRQRCIFFII